MTTWFGFSSLMFWIFNFFVIYICSFHANMIRIFPFDDLDFPFFSSIIVSMTTCLRWKGRSISSATESFPQNTSQILYSPIQFTRILNYFIFPKNTIYSDFKLFQVQFIFPQNTIYQKLRFWILSSRILDSPKIEFTRSSDLKFFQVGF